MKKEKVTVRNYGELLYAVELMQAPVIEICGVIDCGRKQINLKKSQILCGQDSGSALLFNYGTARSAVMMAENAQIIQMKIVIMAEEAPQVSKCKAAIVVNGTGVNLKNLFISITITQKQTSYPDLAYAAIFVRHRVDLSGKIVLVGEGCYAGAVYGDGSLKAQLKLLDGEFSVSLNKTAIAAFSNCRVFLMQGVFEYFYTSSSFMEDKAFNNTELRRHINCQGCYHSESLTEVADGEFFILRPYVKPPTALIKPKWFEFWKK